MRCFIPNFVVNARYLSHLPRSNSVIFSFPENIAKNSELAGMIYGALTKSPELASDGNGKVKPVRSSCCYLHICDSVLVINISQN
jgi:hypothetical protein